MALYTVILDYRGGTYISQTHAEDESSALRSWAQPLDTREIQHLGPSRKRKLILEIDKDLKELNAPFPLNGLQNAWCAGSFLGGGLVNIIKTVAL